MELLRGVYLAGPMAGLSGEDMKTWRIHATERLEAADVAVLDPTRRTAFHTAILDDRGLEQNLAKRIFKQDLRDIARCEILLCDLRDHKGAKAQGTAAEVMFSHMKNKIIIAWKNPGDMLNPFMTAMVTEVYNSVDDAIDAAIDYSE